MGIYIYIYRYNSYLSYTDVLVVLSNCSCISIFSMNSLFLFATEATLCSEQAGDSSCTNWCC